MDPAPTEYYPLQQCTAVMHWLTTSRLQGEPDTADPTALPQPATQNIELQTAQPRPRLALTEPPTPHFGSQPHLAASQGAVGVRNSWRGVQVVDGNFFDHSTECGSTYSDYTSGCPSPIFSQPPASPGRVPRSPSTPYHQFPTESEAGGWPQQPLGGMTGTGPSPPQFETGRPSFSSTSTVTSQSGERMQVTKTEECVMAAAAAMIMPRVPRRKSSIGSLAGRAKLLATPPTSPPNLPVGLLSPPAHLQRSYTVSVPSTPAFIRRGPVSGSVGSLNLPPNPVAPGVVRNARGQHRFLPAKDITMAILLPRSCLSEDRPRKFGTAASLAPDGYNANSTGVITSSAAIVRRPLREVDNRPLFQPHTAAANGITTPLVPGTPAYRNSLDTPIGQRVRLSSGNYSIRDGNVNQAMVTIGNSHGHGATSTTTGAAASRSVQKVEGLITKLYEFWARDVVTDAASLRHSTASPPTSPAALSADLEFIQQRRVLKHIFFEALVTDPAMQNLTIQLSVRAPISGRTAYPPSPVDPISAARAAVAASPMI
ncbi:hypothetical protein IWQ60_012002 [Tieghemiomyces parasiticus]|uniref:Uncharacterized protein n=1 Tax=Tieghemiomyces parasiticus TaxID=78921 RepID=A0A9W7ZM61_9FUNG|nr:hypothetical protein IWQ60_012002 [Tieghemiomyces parasiticus]